MWIMTTYGILMPAERPAGTIDADDERTMQIRARDRRALAQLRKRMNNEMEIDESVVSKIIATPDMDYDYRLYCTPDAFANMMMIEITEIDYVKFKPEALYDDLHSLYNRIWTVVFDHYARRVENKAKKSKLKARKIK